MENKKINDLDLEFEEAEIFKDENSDAFAVDVTLNFNLSDLHNSNALNLKDGQNKIAAIPTPRPKAAHPTIDTDTKVLIKELKQNSEKISDITQVVSTLQNEINSLKKSLDHRYFKKIESEIGKILLEISKESPEHLSKLKRVKGLVAKLNL